jgi:hypothetical protein
MIEDMFEEFYGWFVTLSPLKKVLLTIGVAAFTIALFPYSLALPLLVLLIWGEERQKERLYERQQRAYGRRNN